MILVDNSLIGYYRLGYATNSSSSHYVVIASPSGKLRRGGEEYGYHHSRGYYKLYTPEGKARYIRSVFEWDKGVSSSIVDEVLSDVPHCTSRGETVNSSTWGELSTLGDTTEKDVLMWVKKNIILNDDVVLVGYPEDLDMIEPKDVIYQPSIVIGGSTYHKYRIDRPSGSITVFDNNSGHKFRLIGDNGIPSESEYPELVDISITDKCGQGCDFCYKDSDMSGQHADVSTLTSAVDHMCEYGVFEIAIGGGNPTLHPSFAMLLGYSHNSNVVPNFSVRGSEWLDNEDICTAIHKYAGKYAISALDVDDFAVSASNADGFLEHTLLPTPSIHYIVGLRPLEELKDMMDFCYNEYYQLVLLKYRSQGRGNGNPGYSIEGWDDIVLESGQFRVLNGRNISIDSALVREITDDNISLIDTRTIGQDDGRFSMYYDAVNKRASVSSFSEHSIHCEPDEICTKGFKFAKELASNGEH